MPRVTVEPAGIELEVPPGHTLFAAARQAGVRWPTVCHGAGSFLTCHIVIRAGQDNVSPMKGYEREALEMVRRRYADAAPEDVRLACQTMFSGDAVVFCKSARPAG